MNTLERFKRWLVEKSYAYHQFQADRCLEWLERRKKHSAIELAGFFKLRSDPDE